MAKQLGTRVYWRPSASSAGAAPVQILKNSGYVSITLQAVQYKADGSFWQKTFGGTDKITVATQVTWQNPGDNKTAAAIQDFRKIKVPSTNALAIGRNVALKVPAAGDGIELQVSIHAVHDDNLGKTLQMLNSDEFKQPLQLAPVAVGQALSIANMVKKTFTDVESDALVATYPGIMSAEQMDDPVSTSRLVQGYIIVIVKQDEDDEMDFDPASITVVGNRVLVDGEAIENTYMVYNVTFDKWRGPDENSAWQKKFRDALSKADDLMFAKPADRDSIISAAHDLLMQGRGLLEADNTYRDEEKGQIARTAFTAVADKIKSNLPPPAPAAPGSPAPSPLPKALNLSPEDRAAVASYTDELAANGLPFGFNLSIG
jgi:hypothetical protein